jgi:hypothetical protein
MDEVALQQMRNGIEDRWVGRHRGVLFLLESWLELAEVPAVVRPYIPEMATAIGEFLDRKLD